MAIGSVTTGRGCVFQRLGFEEFNFLFRAGDVFIRSVLLVVLSLFQFRLSCHDAYHHVWFNFGSDIDEVRMIEYRRSPVVTRSTPRRSKVLSLKYI